MELDQRLPRFRERGLQVVAVTYDPPDKIRAFTARHPLRYPVLSDPGSTLIGRFGMTNTAFPEGSGLHGVAYAGSFLIDETGVVRERFVGDNALDRQSAGSILVLAGEPGEAAREVRASRLTVRTSVSNRVVAPGVRFSLVLDFELPEKIHAYAPGARGYRPLALRLDPNPHLRVHEPRFPQPRSYYFAPLKETVPVLEGNFRIVQDVTVGSELREVVDGVEAVRLTTPELTISGVLDYQVCSDELCYPPATVPLRWTVEVRGLVD